MKITAITYGDDNYQLSKKLNLFTAIHIGKANEKISYSKENIDTEFLNKNSKIFAIKHGGGLWLWKPYVIYETLKKIEYDDYLMYLDSGAFYIRKISTLIKCMEKNGDDILLSSSILPNEDWCKKYVFKKMDCIGARKIHQIEGGYILIKKTKKSLEFIKKWLDYSCDFEMISDVSPSELKYENKTFREHRNDQAILTNLAFKYSIEPYKGISDRSEYKYYVNYKDNEFYNYSKKELFYFALKEKESKVFKKSNYKRIIINTRIDTNNIVIFSLKLLKKIVKAFYIDTYCELKARFIFYKYKCTLKSKEGQ